MSNKILNLIFKATDKASPTLDKLQGASGQSGVGGITSELKKLINPATLAMGAVAGLGAFVADSVNDWRNYTLEVADFNAMIDGTIEETSVLIELSKDFNVTMDTMLAAMRSMANSGLEPNIEGLITLREMLDNTSSASERLALAQQMIGEQGIKQILPLLDELNDDQLRNYVDNLTEAELITDDMAEAAREQRKAINNLKDAWQGFQLSLGGEVSEALLDTAFALRVLTGANEEQAEGIRSIRKENFGDIIADWRKRYEELRPVHEDHIEMIGENVVEYGRLRDAAGEVEEATDDLSESQLWALGIAALEAGRTDVAAMYFNEAAAINAKAEAYRNLRSAWSSGQGIGAAIAAAGTAGADWRTYTGPTGPTLTGTGEWQLDALGRKYKVDAQGYVTKGYQAGGSFEVGGSGGPDSQRVGIDVTPGEIVNVSQEDTMRELLLVMKRLPTTIADALERKL